jgi:DNA-binding IclR family transcriptional regulator
MPHETVRRHAAELARAGWCQRVGRGFQVPEEVLRQPAVAGLFRVNAADVHRLFTTLAERGVVEAWERLGVAAPPGS